MRFLIIAATGLIGLGCDLDSGRTTTTGPRAGTVGGGVGIDRVEDPSAPSARGGGPQKSTEYAWPHQARLQLADARCRALAECADVDVEACVTRETQRLANWPGEGCRPLSVNACIEAARTAGCEGMNWALPQTCAATFVCKEAEDVGD
jgi:hypothetical protein